MVKRRSKIGESEGVRFEKESKVRIRYRRGGLIDFEEGGDRYKKEEE
jgi:hypothetical protein